MQKRILIVDDEAFNLVGLKNLMKTLDSFKRLVRLVDLANGGEECIELARKGLDPDSNDHPYIYSLVFMDLSMKPMDGYQATDGLRDVYKEQQ